MIRPPSAQASKSNSPATWIMVSYYLCSAYFVLEGAITIYVFSIPKSGVGALGAIIGAISVGLGLGLLAKVELARGIVNVLCWLKILDGLLGTFTGLMLAAFLGPLGLLLVGIQIFNVLTAAFMIYLIGETDDFMR